MKARAFLALAMLMLVMAGGYALWSVGDSVRSERTTPISVTLPLDAYQLTGRRQAEYDRAKGLLIRACMAKAGFTWESPTGRVHDPHRRRYGVIDLESASSHGYHPPPDPTSERIARMHLAVLRNEQASRVYFGTEDAPEAGCAARASKELTRGAGSHMEGLVYSLSLRSFTASKAHPVVVAAQREWKDCMRSRGHAYSTPEEVLEDPAWNLSMPGASAAERAVAVADVECKQRVRLVERWSRVEAEIQRELIAEHAVPLESVRSALDASLKNAREVLGRVAAPAARLRPVEWWRTTPHRRVAFNGQGRRWLYPPGTSAPAASQKGRGPWYYGNHAWGIHGGVCRLLDGCGFDSSFFTPAYLIPSAFGSTWRVWTAPPGT
ncbi:hypothetical protein [Nonomuraea candida]|uniref:hypothetical protein n=1 Tax=Nonomuraea candida TaxID=359159 RepID=UPI0005BA9DA8|nr:hypothetical protein [Nonomuraea candida]